MIATHFNSRPLGQRRALFLSLGLVIAILAVVFLTFSASLDQWGYQSLTHENRDVPPVEMILEGKRYEWLPIPYKRFSFKNRRGEIIARLRVPGKMTNIGFKPDGPRRWKFHANDAECVIGLDADGFAVLVESVNPK